ncbi:MAG: ABC transporter ATP-binding protein [Clostridium sp.]|jgi:energy-coupling factor transport system ATP-binding protein|uniref:ABC transporter ATP-binding protein n=1 Tax=Clostridium sp. TaxID=1506 RepID=UPI0025C07DE9|nr:ABC transporter ATP-binding protein [Clostridium sp.]MCH3963501.1 ABC transporter ATP-binding protein [Clostridium sp.]MCI1714642.1 ABC transporter ATP-binding protein [Clostridium sp.]MCI1799169.1 ABC transporter ATP-binding protein [Clostridium sp.]MCI1812825.1 ABC transporter ATP-binding protein [Clostridium sp.]MCI1869715.1 ABC transporter ATP-binding protein [Clostridium sp.]
MIQFNNVGFTYKDAKDECIKSLNLTINDGECVLITGKSGCGKTTITRLINGLIPKYFDGKLDGNVIIDGVDLMNLPIYKISEKVGSVFQNPRTQFFNVDTNSEIAFGMENQGIQREIMDETLIKISNELKINDLLKKNIFSLSGGQKQKLAFASVYAMNPDIYLLDEPSSNLDVNAINILKNNILLLKKKKKTIIIVEHRLYYLRNIVDRILYFDQGKLKKEFTSEEFKNLDKLECKKLGLRNVKLNVESIIKTNERNMTNSHTLRVRDFFIGYGKKCILSNININAGRGEIIAIVGNNGVGKTTFVRTICGLIHEISGSIYWNNKKLSCKERLNISYMVLQDVNYQLFADSVENECVLGIDNPNMKLVEETLKSLDIYDYKEVHPNILSGGQKQRTAVAVSILCNKDLLVFDEPSSGLDYDGMNDISNVVKKLSDKGKLIFIVTHDFELISQICSRILYFDKEGIHNEIKEDFFRKSII